jgi:hypothetical protein
VNLKDIIKSKSRNEDTETVEEKVELNDIDLMEKIGSHIEDREEVEQKEEFEKLGGLKCLSKMEEKINCLMKPYAESLTGKEVMVLSEFVKKLNIFIGETRQSYVNDYVKHQTRKSVFEEIVAYLDKEKRGMEDKNLK